MRLRMQSTTDSRFTVDPGLRERVGVVIGVWVDT